MANKERLLRNIGLLTLLYLIAHGLILLNSGVFWDDWVIYKMDPSIIIDTGRQMGQVVFSYLHIWLLSFGNGIISYRITVFLSFLFAGICFYGVLGSLKCFNEFSRVGTVLLFMLFPVNSARISLSTVQYSVCYFLFFMGFWLVAIFKQTKLLPLRISCLIVLFCSFFTNSFLVFYFVILVFLLYYDMENSVVRSISDIFKHLLKHLDFYILPGVFWVIKKIYWVPSKLYSGYNSVGVKGLLNAPLLSLSAFKGSFWLVLKSSLSMLSWEIVCFALLSFGVLFVYFNKHKDLRDKNYGEKELLRNLMGIVLGILFFFIAVFPYATVGKLPRMEDWDSRHQLLIPLGAAIIIKFSLNLLSSKHRLQKNLKLFLYVFLLTLFINSNIQMYLGYQRDWYKQMSVMTNIQASETFKTHNVFLFKDNSQTLNANNRVYRFYELSGMMKDVFGDEKRFGELSSKFTSRDGYKEYLNVHYNLKDYNSLQVTPEYEITINPGPYNLGNVNLVNMMLDEIFNKPRFAQNIKKIVTLSEKKME